MGAIIQSNNTKSISIPSGWKQIDLIDFCTLQRGFDITEATRKPGSIPVYTSSGLAYYHNKSMVAPPGVVTGRKGILGKVFLIDQPFWPHDTTLWVKDFKRNLPAFVALVLRHFHLERLDAATSVPTLNRNNLSGHIVSIPIKIEEQEAIANALSDADAYIDSLEKLIAKKCMIKKGVMQELLTGKRRLQGFKDKWTTACLGDFGYTYGGLTGKTKADFGNGDARYVTFLNVINNVVLDHLLHEKVMLLEGERQNEVRENDLLFNGSSETPEEVAFCSCVKGDLKNLYLNSFCFGFRPTSKGLSSEFMAYYFRSVPGRELVKSLAQGATRYNISKTALLRAPFEIPSFDEQKAIADLLLGVDKDIFISKQKLQKARLIKQGMMQELLTGRIRLV